MREKHLEKRAGPGDPDHSADIARAIRFVWRALQRARAPQARGRIVAAVGLTLLAKIFVVLSPLALAAGINRLTGADAFAPAGLAFGFAGFVLLWALTRFLGAASPNLRDAIFAPVAEAAMRRTAFEAFAHVQTLSLIFHHTKRLGALQRVIERGARAIDFQLRFIFFNIGPTLFELALAAIALTLAYGWQFSATAAGAIAVYAAATILLSDWRLKFRRAMNENDQEATARAADGLVNFETVKAFAAEDMEAARYDQALAAYAGASARATASLALLNGVQALITTLGLLAMALLAGREAAAGRMGPGDIAAVILVMINIYQPLNILGFAWREIKQSAVDMEKLHALFAEAPDVADRPGARVLEAPAGEVRFEEVGFSHDGRLAGLSGLSFTAEAGQMTAIVGPSGSGKSTLLRLLFRFYDPASGRILVDGTDIAACTQKSLRAVLGLVPQEVVLFNDSIEYNLLYGRPGASRAAMREAARAAHLLDFIESLPEGFATRVGERGLKLSGGERQRLGIARVLLRDPKILVLDEATSALDSVTEQSVQAALERAAAGRTTLVVAHRLSTIRGADRILVLEGGRVVEQGDHASLIAHDGLYAELWRRQAQEPAPDGALRHAGPEPAGKDSVGRDSVGTDSGESPDLLPNPRMHAI